MVEPVKPFACIIPDCGMTFTNEDHLHVHTKKHDMVLQLGLEQKSAFVADQTPTPTRFIRNCEEVGLFQDLQNVAANPFDEGFKRAMETKAGILSLESTITPASDDVLHTPQMVFPMLDNGDPTLYNNQRNVAISRSSSDESGTIKEFETRTVSKLTNEVTTISRIVTDHNDDVTNKHIDAHKDVETVSYKNNVIRIESNVIRKDVDNKMPVLVYSDSVVKGTCKDSLVDNSKLNPEKLPIMSQKSIDFVVDSLTSDLATHAPQNVEQNNKKQTFNILPDDLATLRKMFAKKSTQPKIIRPILMPKNVKSSVEERDKKMNTDGIEVVIKLPDGNQVRMKPVEEKTETKNALRHKLTNKTTKRPPILIKQVLKKSSVVKIPTGTLIPVTLVDQKGTPLSNDDLTNVPITKINNVSDIANLKLPVPTTTPKVIKRKPTYIIRKETPPKPNNEICIKVSEPYQLEETDTNEKTKLAEPNNVISLTEEDVSKKIEERNKAKLIDDDCVLIEDGDDDDDDEKQSPKRQRLSAERRCAASKRYRDRLKQAMEKQREEIRQLRERNQRLTAEKAVFKLVITEHMKHCPNAADIASRMSVLTGGSESVIIGL